MASAHTITGQIVHLLGGLVPVEVIEIMQIDKRKRLLRTLAEKLLSPSRFSDSQFKQLSENIAERQQHRRTNQQNITADSAASLFYVDRSASKLPFVGNKAEHEATTTAVITEGTDLHPSQGEEKKLRPKSARKRPILEVASATETNATLGRRRTRRRDTTKPQN
eukprot:SAG31_NODE_271_length_18717_cov_8.685949_1_plen_165_part_00